VLDNKIRDLGLRVLGGPVSSLVNELTPVSYFFKTFSEWPDLAKENLRLESENQKLVARLGEEESIKVENNFLRDQLNLAPKINGELVLGKIVSANRSQSSSTVMINRGSKDGVERKMAVLSSSNILLGIIEEVFNERSLVLMLDDPRLVIASRVINKNIIGSSRGTLGKIFEIDFITGDDQIDPEDIIVTSGMDSLPEGLVMGRVLKVSDVVDDIFKEVRVEMVFDVSLGPNVFVVK